MEKGLNSSEPQEIEFRRVEESDYPEWIDVIVVNDGISVDLFVGEPAYLHRGFGRAALCGYLLELAFPYYASETCAYIAHESLNTAALRCSRAVGFRPLRTFLEGSVEMVLLSSNRLSIEGGTTAGRCVSESPHPLIASQCRPFVGDLTKRDRAGI